MNDLDRKLAEAASVAAKLKANKWGAPAQEEKPRRRLNIEEEPEIPNAVTTPARRNVLKTFIKQETARLARENDRATRSDLNSVLKTFEDDFDDKIHKIDDQIASIAHVENDLRKLYEDMRPKQFVLQQGGEITPLGDQIDDPSHYLLPVLMKAINVRDKKGNRKNVLLKGPAGSGKSTAGVQVSEALGLDFNYIGQTLMPHQIEGYVRQGDGVYVDTAFVRTFRDGGIVMLEEMDAWSPQATLVANPPLANGYMSLPNGEMIKRHEDCVIIACANTWGSGATAEYVGRNKLDAAFLDRFAFKFDWKYDDELERMAAQNEDLVTKVQIMRMNAHKAGIKILISPRTSIDCADMVRTGFTETEALELNCLAELSPDQRKTVLSGVTLDS